MTRRPTDTLAAALAAALLLPVSAAAEGEDAIRSAGDMTVDERAELMRATHRYQRCVYDAAMSSLEASNDVRVIADQAFETCASDMQSMVTWFEDQGFESGFAEGYTRHMRDQAGRKLLPELMMRKSGG